MQKLPSTDLTRPPPTPPPAVLTGGRACERDVLRGRGTTRGNHPLPGFPSPIIYQGRRRRRRTEVIGQRASTHTLGAPPLCPPAPPLQPLLPPWEAGEI